MNIGEGTKEKRIAKAIGLRSLILTTMSRASLQKQGYAF